MYTKEEIWNSFAKEFRIIRHLVEKIPGGGYDHKPTEKQRTMLELLQYMGVSGIGTMTSIKNGDTSAFGPLAALSKEITPENFVETINKEEADMKDLFDSFTEDFLNEEITLFAGPSPRKIYILDLLKTITAYKMQLFLYIKAAGNESIGTPNLWAGIDTPTA